MKWAKRYFKVILIIFPFHALKWDILKTLDPVQWFLKVQYSIPFYCFFLNKSSIREMEKYPVSAGLDKLYARWRACTQHAGKKVFACTKLNARKSIKKPFSSTVMFFKVVSCFCVRNQIIFGTIRTDIHRLFQLRSCCYIVISSVM